MLGHDKDKLPLAGVMAKIGSAAVIIGSIGIFFMMILTVVSVFWRYALNDALFGTEDLQVLAAAVVVACAIYYGALHVVHVTIELMECHVSTRILGYPNILVNALTAGILVVATRAVIKKGGCRFECGAITVNLRIEHTPFYYILALSCALTALLSLIRHYQCLFAWEAN